MSKKLFLVFSLLMVFAMLLSACGQKTATVTEVATEAPVVSTGPELITGEMTYSNDFAVEYYFYEQMAALTDMHGFVIRDREWELPVESQALGYMKVDGDNNKASYRLALPIKPEGVLNDVDNNGKEDKGVQIFAVTYSPNLTGGPYADGDDKSLGWPGYIGSVVIDSELNDEVVGGKLVIWAPDAAQQFPTGFGDDSLLFTKDDPVGPIPAGYSIVDLDQKPFAFSQEVNPQIALLEPKDYAIKDFSALSYTEAFDKMFNTLKAEYAFNDQPGKAPKWDELYKELAPRVKDAEAKKDAKAYFLAIKDFTYAFKDGHVGVSGGEADDAVFTELSTYGYGLSLRELTDGTFVVVYVMEEAPAALAGIQVGATITDWNDMPLGDARDKVNAYSGPFSTDHTRKYQQLRYLLRAKEGEEAKVVFTNPGETAPKTATLKAFPERNSFSFTSVMKGFDYNALPVEFRILDSGVGYIKLNSNYDDLNMLMRLFERALATFQANELPGIIIDLRQNNGGQPLGLAGYLIDKDIPTGQDQYFSSKSGKFENQGVEGKITPMENTYKFDKMVLLVDQGCSSACEFEAYGFSQVPGMIVVGQYPTGGLYGDVARGQFILPEGISLQAPTGRTVMPDGKVLLEGVGVVPTDLVPVTAEAVLSGEDYVLNYAVNLIVGQ